jgi:hypothetical protein
MRSFVFRKISDGWIIIVVMAAGLSGRMGLAGTWGTD